MRRHPLRLRALLSGLLLAVSCGNSVLAGNDFEEVSASAGISYRQFRGYDCHDAVSCGPEFMTGGGAAGDYDGDGLVDLFTTRIDDTPILYRNNGDGTFDDRTREAGLDMDGKLMKSNGAAWADLNNDGCVDLVVTATHDFRNYLFVGDCTGRFKEDGVDRGLGYPAPEPSVYSFGVAVGDYDRDGYLDLYISEWRLDALYPGARGNSRLLRNKGKAGPGYFDDVTAKAGATAHTTGGFLSGHFSFAPVFADLDGDGWQDLAIAADFGTSGLFWNNGDGTFTDGTAEAGVGTDENGMGAVVFDYNGDGLLDWFVTSIYQSEPECTNPAGENEICALWGQSGNRLYRNDGERKFSDQTDEAGVRDGGWGWGAAEIDVRNSGRRDIAQTAGQFWPYQGMGADLFNDDPTFLWMSDGRGRFSNMAAPAGISQTTTGKGLLTFDYDRNGFLDVFISENFGKPKLFRNLNGNNGSSWIRVSPVGAVSNTDGTGSKITVRVRPGGPLLYHEVLGGSMFLGQSEKGVHFGLGPDARTVAEITVNWPVSGCTKTYRDVSSAQVFSPAEADCLSRGNFAG